MLIKIHAIRSTGGNTCNDVTSTDSVSILLAFDAVVELTGSEGVRKVPIEKFYVKAGQVDIRPGEIQTGILIAKESYENCKGHYIKYGMRNAMEIAAVGCSVNVRLSQDRKRVRQGAPLGGTSRVDRLRIGFGVAAPVPVRARRTEEAFCGADVSLETAEGISISVLEDVNPRDSRRASRDIAPCICVRRRPSAHLLRL